MTKEKQPDNSLGIGKAKAKKSVARDEQGEQKTMAADPTTLPSMLSSSLHDTNLRTQADNLANPAIGLSLRQATAAEIGRLAGNQYLQRLVIQMEDDAKAKGGKKTKKLKKKMIDKAKSVAILEETYSAYKKIGGGTVKYLGQADFEKAWDAINPPEFSWAKYVIPKYGNLEGFADLAKDIYINNDLPSVDVVPHEMLHNNADLSWGDDDASSNIFEGATEYLTIKAVKAADYKPTHSYPNQERVIRKLVKVVGEWTLITAYFYGLGLLMKAVDYNCVGSWDDFKKAMDESKWIKARRLLKKKI